ncbi:S9 family peptidase [Fulvivirga sediminis]|nr:prolyl oligopeptidase family serine peptidase [Fulvivirga sediminis]
MIRILCCFLLISFAAKAQYSSNLSIPEIMKGEDFVGYLPERVQWSPDSRYIYFSWNPDHELVRSMYKVETATGKISKMTDDEQKSRVYIDTYNDDHTLMVYSKDGDLFLYNTKTGSVKQITNTLESESGPEFSGDQKQVIYSVGKNLFSWSITDGTTRQLSNFKSGSEKKDSKASSQEEWLKNDQLALFEVLNERKEESELSKEQLENLKPERPLEIYVGDKDVFDQKVSPDMAYITYRLRKEAKHKNTEVTHFVTESGYTTQSPARSKVGIEEDTYEMGIYDIKNDTTYTLDTKEIEGIYNKPAFLEDYADGDFDPKYETPREVIFHGPFFSKNGNAFVDIRSQDNKDRWIMLLDLASGKLTLVDHQHDDAWIGGPGISSWNFFPGNLGWLADNETIWFQSEETGYSHLYTYNIKTKKKKALTKGDFEIREAKLSNDKKYFYLQSNKVSPHVNHFYKMPVTGGKMTQITSSEGQNDVTISPDEKQLAVLYSYSNKPTELYLMKNSEGAVMKQLTNSTTEAFDAYSWKDPEIIRFEAEDGAKVPARIYKPEKPNGAAVIFVHGAGYLQNVHKWWSSYYREFMFHNYLTDMGYTVLDIDYRGSDGYGRDWRTGIYRWMGGKDLSDQVDGAAYLVKEQGIDKDRIGIYGGSYGGFITLMAMFTAPDTFQSGAALRSVTDWAHYNHGYTANILNTPVQDSIAYAKSSPIYFAEGLKGKLVMLHGMVDDNVQFQDVVRLSQRLIELGKKDWDLAVFPMERHGFVEASSWADEYRRIYELFEETLKKEE